MGNAAKRVSPADPLLRLMHCHAPRRTPLDCVAWLGLDLMEIQHNAIGFAP